MRAISEVFVECPRGPQVLCQIDVSTGEQGQSFIPVSSYRHHTLFQIGFEALRDKALAFLQNNITEQNILTEITSSLISR